LGNSVFSIHDASTPVGSERGGSTDLSPEDSRPHYLMLSSVCTSCGFRNEFSTSWLYSGVQGSAWRCTRYLGPLTRVDDLPGRRTLRSTNANRILVPPVKLLTVGSRAFAVAAPHIWNTLPADIVAANSLSTFRRLLYRTFFIQAVISRHHLLTPSG